MTDQPALVAALIQLQARMPRIERSETATVETQRGSYSYSFASLAPVTTALKPLMAELGLAFTASPTLDEAGRFVLRYRLLHSSGEECGGDYPLPASGTPQAVGSAITYARRYCLMAVTGAVSEKDDDDAAAAQAEARRQTRRASRDTARPASRDDQESGTRTPGAMTDAQRRRLMQLFNQAGFKDRGERLAHCAAAIGRDVASSAELTTREAALIISGLEQVIAERPGADEVPS